MKRTLSIALAILFGLSALGCATVTPPAARNIAASADLSCRRVATPDGTSNGALKEYCGTTAQWAQFDRSIAKAGMSCRNTLKSDAVCLFDKQWEYRDQHQVVAGAGFGFQTDPTQLSPSYQSQVLTQRASDVGNGYTVPVF
jgi:hypothetical protein